MSRISVLGPLAGVIENNSEETEIKSKNVTKSWKLVKNPDHKPNNTENIDGERLLEDQDVKNNEDDENIEEITLLEQKRSGFRRETPQEVSINFEKSHAMFKCSECECSLESKGLLRAHLKTHESLKFACEKCDELFPKENILKKHISEVHEKSQPIPCESCDLKFTSDSEMEKHIKTMHTSVIEPEQWNCNDCAFQANFASELMNHLKHMGHAPSKAKKDNRQTFKDFKQCYTCKREFDGYWNLMTHRKQVHPSNRKCRNYPGN